MIIPHETKNRAIESFNVTDDDYISMASIVSRNCFKFGYRVVPFKNKDDPLKYLIESPDLTTDHILRRLRALNPARKRPIKSVTIPLVDLRCGKVNGGLIFTIRTFKNRQHLCCDAKEIVTDYSGLAACG